MRKLVVIAVLPMMFGATCKDCEDDGASVDGGGSTNPGFAPPTAVTQANMRSGGVWVPIGAADWSCLETPTADQPSTRSIMLAGELDDFQNGDPVGSAQITAFPGITVTGNLGLAMSSNVAATRGQFSMTLSMLPAGETRHGFRIDASSFLRTYVLGLYVDPMMATSMRDLMAVSESTANALPAFIGVTRDIADGLVAGVLHDCAGHEVSNAIVTVSTISGMVSELPGADTYYFSAASSSLPVRHNQSPSSNKDGLFAVLSLPPQTAPAFVQAWGFTTAEELAAGQLHLLAEQPAPIEANAIMGAALEPRRTH